MAHTPGPWRWEVNRRSRRIALCGGPPKSGYGKYDLDVMTFGRWGMSGAAPIFWKWTGMFGEPTRADTLAVEVPGREHHADWFADLDHPDARLIAAAPELLEALQETTAIVERLLIAGEFHAADVCDANVSMENSRAAIAKATDPS